MKLKPKKNEHGRNYVEFQDAYDNSCSLQESGASAPHIWLGCEKNVEPHHVTGDELSPRMHLSQTQVKALLPLLKKFIKTGVIA